MSNWFYDDINIGSKIKSPIDLIIGMKKTIPFTFEDDLDIIKIQKLLGQLLFFPPNVAGWKGGKSWIDTNTIMLRLRLPSILYSDLSIESNDDSLENNFRVQYLKKLKNKVLKTEVSWNDFNENYKSIATEDLSNLIITTDFNSGTKAYFNSLSKKSKQDICIQLMSLPEYQMC